MLWKEQNGSLFDLENNFMKSVHTKVTNFFFKSIHFCKVDQLSQLLHHLQDVLTDESCDLCALLHPLTSRNCHPQTSSHVAILDRKYPRTLHRFEVFHQNKKKSFHTRKKSSAEQLEVFHSQNFLTIFHVVIFRRFYSSLVILS